jgi:hypothetical protein
MADTNHSHSSDIPTEGDGVSYSGIGWFLVVLIVTVVGCQLFVVGLFKFTERYRLNRPEIVRAPLAAPAAQPTLVGGRLETGMEAGPSPALLVNEPAILRTFHDAEMKALHTYGWVNQGAGTVRLTIDRAKELVLERNMLPARETPAAAPAQATPAAPAAAPAAPSHAPAPPSGH